MRASFITLCVFLPATALAAPTPSLSWGKPGVSLATYRAESVACAMRAYYTDLSDTKAAKSFVEGSRQIDAIVNSGGDAMMKAAMIGHAADAVRPEQRLQEARDYQYDLLAKCLIARGYHRFRLTDDQRLKLTKLKIGSEARHAYLHSLASNPSVLATQREADPPLTPSTETSSSHPH